MTTEKPSQPAQICPTCGTRVREDSDRCQVCGTNVVSGGKSSSSSKAVQGSRLPQVTLSLPVIIGLLAIFLAIGAVLVYFALGQVASPEVQPTASSTITLTTTPTQTSTPVTPTITNTPLPTPTPLSYTVQLGDTCGGIAYRFNVSIQSIVLTNNLPADCSNLIEGKILQIPHPTPTPTQLPTATLSSSEATVAACQTLEYTVQENDTLSSIAANYAIPQETLKDWNGLVNNVVRIGQQLVIPLCERPDPSRPTPAPTAPPPYSAPDLLLPPDGAPFSDETGTVTLQWASVGTLRENESYEITIEDVTGGEARKLVEYTTDTKFIIPDSFFPNERVPHVIRWWVASVRQTGTDDDGNPIWSPAGTTSNPRTLTWMIVLGTIPQETPTP